MKLIALLTSLLFIVDLLVAQQLPIDSLSREARITQNDTLKLVWLRTIAYHYGELNPDSAYHYSEKSLELSRKLKFKLDEGGSLREMGYALINMGAYPRSLQTLLASLNILEDPESEQNVLVGNFPGDDIVLHRTASPHAQRLSAIGFTHAILGILYANSNELEKSLHHEWLARKKGEQSGNVTLTHGVNLALNRIYLYLGKKDSAMITIQLAYNHVVQSDYKRLFGSILLNMGRTYASLGNTSKANEYYRKAAEASAEYGYFRGVVASNFSLADYHFTTGANDSAFHYTKNALSVAQNLNAPDLLLRSYTRLNRYYRIVGNNDSLAKYQALVIKINEGLFNAKQAQEFQNIDFNVQQQQQEIIATKKEYQNRLQKYLMLVGLGVFSTIALILLRNNRQKQKANKVLESALADLKSTQSLLIQSEKMASLGELTAGIAHEIQNPLNFVKNFSEVNKELLSEMKEEIENGNLDDAKSLANSVIENEEKINHHGKRADAIVKGMLQHSRSSSGVKEPTNINLLADEYLRLAYHGFRAKGKSFNVTTKTNLDGAIGLVNIVPQEIGRVVLNLLNNAFYAVSEKKRQIGDSYEPTVSIETRRSGDKVLISVRDNGIGIDEKILDKIFQPFYTTKSAGQGTGLGLSLSYDIVKAHNGVINVITNKNEGAEFVIELPLVDN